MESFSCKELNEIMAVLGNQTCVECKAKSPKWCSLNNAVFLCAKCARIHQGISRSFSLVKSLEVDVFKPEEIKMLQLGGNDRFINLMTEYNVPLDSTPDFKYHLQIAEYYRQLLAAEANKEANPEKYHELLDLKPNNEIGIKLLEGIMLEHDTPTGEQNRNEAHEEVKKDFQYVFSNVNAMFCVFREAVSDKVHQMGIDTKFMEVKDAITGKISQIPVSDGIKEAGNKTLEYAKKGGEYIADKSMQVYNSETFQSMARKAEQQYLDLKMKTQAYLNKDQPQAQAQDQPQAQSQSQEQSQAPQQQEQPQPQTKTPVSSQTDNKEMTSK